MQKSVDLSLSISPLPSDPDQYCWTRKERRQFKKALCEFTTATENFYDKIASGVQSKTAKQVQEYYECCYNLEGSFHKNVVENTASSSNQQYPKRLKVSKWTEKEHKRFVMGLKRYGEGQWKKIAKDFVWNKSSSQVAAHADRYFKHIKETRAKPQDIDIIKASSTASAKRFKGEPSDAAIQEAKEQSTTLDLAPNPTVQEDGQTLNLFPILANQEDGSTLNSFPVATFEASGKAMNLLPLFPM